MPSKPKSSKPTPPRPAAESSRAPALVTGGAGFLGSHLCDRLLAADHAVVCLDNFYTGSERNIAHLLGEPGFELLRHDVTIPLASDSPATSAPSMSSLAGVRDIYNLACPASPPHYQHAPIETTRTSVVGALHMLELAERLGARILQASTSEVYGDPQQHPQTEDYWGHVNPIGRRSCYDEGKRCAETLFFDYHREVGLEIKVARIFNTYGPRMAPDDGRVVSNFIVAALRGDPILLFGDGRQTRAFCYVDDLIEGLVAMMLSPAETTGPINLGNPVEFTMQELAELVLELTQSKSEIRFAPLPADDPVRRCPDTTRAKEELEWAPRTSLRTGLARTIDYFDAML